MITSSANLPAKDATALKPAHLGQPSPFFEFFQEFPIKFVSGRTCVQAVSITASEIEDETAYMRHLRHADSGSVFVSCESVGARANAMLSHTHLNREQVRDDAGFWHRLQHHCPADSASEGVRECR
jgi:hypothetical protein